MAFNEGLWGVRWVEGGMLLQYVSKMVPSTEIIRLIGDGGGGGGGMRYGGGRGRLYTYRYTVTTRMTPALKWAAMRAILMCN